MPVKKNILNKLVALIFIWWKNAFLGSSRRCSVP